MMNISSVRLAVPKADSGKLLRRRLIGVIRKDQKKLTYIHAGAGYGKTTLLSQIALSAECSVWASLDGENDVFSFLDLLSMALRHTFPHYGFNATEYMPFEESSNFISVLSNAFIASIENVMRDFIIVLDDVHTIDTPQVRYLIASIVKYSPEHIRFCLSSREAPWKEFAPLRVRGTTLGDYAERPRFYKGRDSGSPGL